MTFKHVDPCSAGPANPSCGGSSPEVSQACFAPPGPPAAQETSQDFCEGLQRPTSAPTAEAAASDSELILGCSGEVLEAGPTAPALSMAQVLCVAGVEATGWGGAQLCRR